MLAAVVVAGCVAMPALAASDADCRAMWKKADVNNDGQLSDAEAQRYLAMMRVGNRPLPERFDEATFMNDCKADAFSQHKVDAGAPLKGANSFTEGQARDRALAHGFGNVGDLKKDDDGIWRGRATQDDGKQVEIAVDYKGNVVSRTQ
jgi:hypothetical protein